MHNLPSKNSGFTIIEYMAAIAMVVVLISFASLFYNQYITEVKAGEAVHNILATGENVKQISALSSCTANGLYSSRAASFGDIKITGTYTAKSGGTCPTGCNATFTFNDDAPSELKGKKLSADILNSGQMSLSAANTTLSPIYYQNELKVISKQQSDTCASISLNASNPNPAVSIDGLEPDTAKLVKSKMIPSYYNSVNYAYNTSDSTIDFYIKNKDPSIFIRNPSLDKPLTLYIKLKHVLFRPDEFLTPKFLSFTGVYRYQPGWNDSFIPYKRYHAWSDSDNYIIEGYPYAAILNDNTVVDISPAQTFYINKDKHLISALQVQVSNYQTWMAYPSITFELMNEIVNPSNGSVQLEPRGISFNLKRIEGIKPTTGALQMPNYYALVDLGEMPNPIPPYLTTGWSKSLLNKKSEYIQYGGAKFNSFEGAIKVTFNKT